MLDLVIVLKQSFEFSNGIINVIIVGYFYEVMFETSCSCTLATRGSTVKRVNVATFPFCAPGHAAKGPMRHDTSLSVPSVAPCAADRCAIRMKSKLDVLYGVATHYLHVQVSS